MNNNIRIKIKEITVNQILLENGQIYNYIESVKLSNAQIMIIFPQIIVTNMY